MHKRSHTKRIHAGKYAAEVDIEWLEDDTGWSPYLSVADGTTSLFDIYEATVLWDGAPRRVAVDAADINPLVGMRLLDGYELTVQAIVGSQVFITALP